MGDDGQVREAAPQEPGPAVALRVVAAATLHVLHNRWFADFPQVLTFLENVAAAAPDLVTFQHMTKLRLGLQAKIIMNMLQEDEPPWKIYNALDIYFPENAEVFCHTKATSEELQMAQIAQENFRILVLWLLSHHTDKEIYVQRYLETDYGEGFMDVVEDLFRDFLCQMEHILPEPELQTLLEAATFQPSTQPPHPSVTLLNEYFCVVGYQRAGCDEPPNSPPFLPCTSGQNDDNTPCTPPLTPQPGRSHSEDSPSSISERDSQCLETSEDLVPDSCSESSTSSFQVE